MRAVTRECIKLGVKYIPADVASLQFDDEGHCSGVKTVLGNIISASHTIVCTGAFTPKLLEWSAQSSGNKELRAGSRIVAGGITTGMAKLGEEDYQRFKDMPVGVQGYTPKIGKQGRASCILRSILTPRSGPFIGSLPPTPDRELKWWGQKIFRNTQEVAPGRFISAPPAERDYAQWKVTGKLKEDIAYANHVFYGKNGASWNMEKHRICW